MVAKFAPQFSNIFMAGLESDMFEQSKVTPLLWRLHLDHLFCVLNSASIFFK